MSGSKLLRLCSLFLCLLLCLANFSVVANASEAEENLIDSDIRNWTDISDLNSTFTPFQVWDLEDIYGINVYRLGWNAPSKETNLTSHVIFTLPNLYVGDNYTLKFRVNVPSVSSLQRISWFIGFGYIDPATNLPSSIDNNSFIQLTEENMVGAIGNISKEVSYKEFTINYTHKETLGTPCVCIQGTLIDNDASGWHTLRFLADSFILTRAPSETDIKLDGILGWLQELWNSIVSGFENLGSAVSNNTTELGTKMVSFKNWVKQFIETLSSDIKTNLETLSGNITTKLGNISTDFNGYISNLGDRVSSFFSDLKTSITSEFTAFKNKVNTEFTNLKSNLTTNFDNLKNTLSSRFDKVDNFLTEIRDFFHNLYWDLVGGTCGAGDVHSSLFERLGDRIRGFFEDLKVKIDVKVEEIKTSIYNFFVPPEGFFDEYRESFNLMLSENLGIIYTAVDFTSSLVEHIQDLLNNKDEEISYSFPAIEFDVAGQHIVLFENETPVDFSFLYEDGNNFSQLYGMYEVILRVILIFALIGYALSVWKKMIAN